MNKLIRIATFYLLLLMALPSQAVDRALLIGIGKYQNQIDDLPGVKIDIENMRQSAHLMGYADDQIKVIMDEEVTLAKLKSVFKSWLIDGTNRDDRVLIYFSGHGSRIPDYNGDEKDGADEVLVMYDSKIVLRNNKRTIKNALLDDELSRFLKKIKSQDVMLLVDACNSGTVYRGFTGEKYSSQVYPKFLSYSGIPKKDKNKTYLSEPSNNYALDTESFPAKSYRFVALTAAGDNELALATKNGSLFTSGIKYYLQQAARNNTPITPKQLSEKVALYIQEKVQQEKLGAVYSPQLAGNSRLVNKNIPVSPIIVGDNWGNLEQLSGPILPGAKQKLKIYPNQSILHVGDILEIQLKIPQAGYLNVINVDPTDSIFVVYPSSSKSNNWVSAGSLTIPTPEMGYQLQLTEPSGENLFFAVLSEKPINVYAGIGADKRLSGEGIAALFKQQSAGKFIAGKLILDIRNP